MPASREDLLKELEEAKAELYQLEEDQRICDGIVAALIGPDTGGPKTPYPGMLRAKRRWTRALEALENHVEKEG